VNRNGKIAMKLEGEGDGIVGVQTCTEHDDILLTTAGGLCIRFPVGDLRVFKGRDSMGVRGISLGPNDRVISLTILHHFKATPAERIAYLKQASAIRRAATGEDADDPLVEASEETAEEGAGGGEAEGYINAERYAQMGASEQFILTVNERGYGKRSSSYEFRISGRGGKGIRATDISRIDEIGALIAAFPVEPSDQIMLVSNGGTLIRVPIEGIRFASRTSKGVRIFNTAEGEKVVSVEHIPDPGDTEPEVGSAGDGPAQAGDADVPETPTGE
jgi:DNA gyrase subunit A